MQRTVERTSATNSRKDLNDLIIIFLAEYIKRKNSVKCYDLTSKLSI